MNSTIETPHLNPLPSSGERRIGQRGPRKDGAVTLASAAQIRLSLSQRERMEVRDCCQRDSRARTKSTAEHCRVPRAPDDSKIGVLQFRAARKTDLASDHAFGPFDSCVRLRQVQRRVLRKDNRNPVCTDRPNAVVETCSQRSFGFADAAKERAPIWLRAYGGCERGSQGYLALSWFFREVGSTPHLNPLAGMGGRRNRPSRVAFCWNSRDHECDIDSPLPFPKGEDGGEGLLLWRSSKSKWVGEEINSTN